MSNPTIATAEELLAIPEFKEGVVYEIVADIDMKGVKLPEEKACIEGVLEGNGHRIYNLEEGPLFEDNEGIIRNLIIECNIHIENREDGKNFYVAALVDTNDGTVERCISKGTICIVGDYIEAAGLVVRNEKNIYQCGNEVDFVAGGMVLNPLGIEEKNQHTRIGGIATRARGTIEECYNWGDITIAEDGSAGYLGGIVADADGSVENCYNTGNAYSNGSQAGIKGGGASSTATNCCNFGDYAAGIQIDTNAYIADCYYLESMSGREKAVCKVYGEPYLGSRSYEELECQRVLLAALE